MNDVDETIKALRNKIGILQGQIKELMRAKEIIDAVSSIPAEVSSNGDKPTSIVGMTDQILQDTGHDLHVDRIIEGILKRYKVKVKKNSLAASLSKYASDKHVFKKTGGQKNTFGLLEWEEGKVKVA